MTLAQPDVPGVLSYMLHVQNDISIYQHITWDAAQVTLSAPAPCRTGWPALHHRLSVIIKHSYQAGCSQLRLRAHTYIQYEVYLCTLLTTHLRARLA